jgi:hypothetical protein
MPAKQNGEGAKHLHRRGDSETAELTLFLGRASLDARVAARELFKSASRIDELMFASEKGVASRADANPDVTPC